VKKKKNLYYHWAVVIVTIVEGRLYLSKSNRRLVKRIQPANIFNGIIFVCACCKLIRSRKLTDVAATIANGNKIEKIHSLTIIDLKSCVESIVNGRPKPRKYGQYNSIRSTRCLTLKFPYIHAYSNA